MTVKIDDGTVMETRDAFEKIVTGLVNAGASPSQLVIGFSNAMGYGSLLRESDNLEYSEKQINKIMEYFDSISEILGKIERDSS